MFVIIHRANVQCLPKRADPGPKLAAATGLLWSYFVVKGEEARWVYQCHENYGEVVRIGPDRLSFTNPQAWKDIQGHRTGGRKENSKDRRMLSTEYNNTDSIAAIDDPLEHSRVRKIFTNAFSDKALRFQEPLIHGYVNKLMNNITGIILKDPNIHMNLVKLYNCTTFDIMGDLAFGEPLGMLDTGEYTPWVKAVFNNMKVLSIARIASEYPLFGRIFHALTPKSLQEQRRLHFDHSAQRVNRRLEKGINIGKSDIWQLVLEKGDNKLTVDEMHSNASTFMIAGTETTATLLSGLTFLLLKNPAKMRKVLEEVRALPLDQLTLAMLPRLPYMNACFEEGLRCYPPVPGGLPRVIAKGGNAICGDWLPEGVCIVARLVDCSLTDNIMQTRVCVYHMAAYRSPLNFKNPNAFEPERWLPNTGYDSDRRDVMQAFSFGPRNCLGKKYV
jgi:cytochrome P450